MGDIFDYEAFIEEIKKYPEIWDISNVFYHDRKKKKEAWVNICYRLYDAFDEKPDTNKNEICSKLMKKWRNTRDSYFKNLRKRIKSGQTVDSGRRYIYADQLSFLQNMGSTVETQFGLDGNEEEEAMEQQVEDPEQTNQSEPLAQNHDQAMKRKRDVESTLIDFVKAPVFPSAIGSIPEPNPDRSFFESILPFINEFDEDMKLEFRSEILNLIKRIRNSSKSRDQMIQSHNMMTLNHRMQANANYSTSTPKSSNALSQSSIKIETYDMSDEI